jgi:branched-chain amino acid transport system permease protein
MPQAAPTDKGLLPHPGKERGTVPNADILVQAVVNGLLLGGVYALLAAGLTIIVGVLDVLNFAQGEFFMLGALCAWLLNLLLGVNPYVALLIIGPAAFLVGYAVEKVLLSRAAQRPPLVSLIVTFGLSYFLIGAAQALFGNRIRSVPYFQGSWSFAGIQFVQARTVAFAVAVFLLVGIYLALHHTRLGKAVRATAQHDEVARTCGINVGRMRSLAFSTGIAMAAMAGVLLVPVFAIGPETGQLFVIKAFAVVILGGLGSFGGALIGGLVLGLVEVFGSLLVSPALGQGAAYVVLLLVLLLRPGGIMGESGAKAV